MTLQTKTYGLTHQFCLILTHYVKVEAVMVLCNVQDFMLNLTERK